MDNAVEAIYRDLEYARSLIKQPTTPDEQHYDGEVAGDLPDTSIGSSAGGSKESDWSMLSGSEGDANEQHRQANRQGLPHREGSGATNSSSKRASISGAINALIPKPSMLRRASSTDPPTQK